MAQLHHLLKTKFYSVLPGTVLACDLTIGQHPRLLGPFLDDHIPRVNTLQPTEFMPLSHHHAGHHMVISHGHTPHTITPIAPLYVRDLAGRILLTPLNYQQVNHAPLTPIACAYLTPQQAEAAQLERIILTHLRPLELGLEPATNLDLPAGYAHLPLYQNPHAYPYKLRLDTFYIDGFRLPQLELLHVPKTSPNQALNASQQFTQRWQQAQVVGQSYEDFYHLNNGPTWYEDLFQQGCTIIPTTEAFNGCYQVDENYGMLDVYPGRAVSGLHAVVGMEDSDLPPQTILRVIAPGFATRQSIQPAQVIVSNGKNYQPPAAPQPLLPNLALPHPRVGGAWGDVWLPTHPQHFVQPALWHWLPQGGFAQFSGPLWDPVHYVYASTRPILSALRRHTGSEQEAFAPTPPHMQPRFFPIIPLSWFDNPSAHSAKTRSNLPTQHPLAATALDASISTQAMAEVGYHPLPPSLDVELEPMLCIGNMPHQQTSCPQEFQDRLAPIIQSQLTPTLSRQTALMHHNPAEAEFYNHQLYAEKDNPYLHMQRGQSDLALNHAAAFLPVYLPAIDQSELFPNFRRLFGRVGYAEQLAQWHGQMLTWLQTFSEASSSQQRLLYRYQRRYLAEYIEKWWKCEGMSEPSRLETPPEQAIALWAIIASSQPALQAQHTPIYHSPNSAAVPIGSDDDLA